MLDVVAVVEAVDGLSSDSVDCFFSFCFAIFSLIVTSPLIRWQRMLRIFSAILVP